MKIYHYLFSFLVTSFFIISQINAAGFVSPPDWTIDFPDITTWDSADMISSIIAWMIWLTAVLTILAITWAWVQMVLAIGEEEKMKKARHTMIYAFIWLIVSWLAYAAVTLVINLNFNTI